MMYLFKGCFITQSQPCKYTDESQLYSYVPRRAVLHTHARLHARSHTRKRLTQSHIRTYCHYNHGFSPTQTHSHILLTRYRQSSGTSHLKSGFLKYIYTKDPFHNSKLFEDLTISQWDFNFPILTEVSQ